MLLYSNSLLRCELLINSVQRAFSVVFYGSDLFSLESLKTLVTYRESKKLITKLHVITKPNTVVAKWSCDNGIEASHWPHTLSANQFDLGIVVSFGAMIDDKSITSCKYGMINMHPSLLPRWRGSSPIQRTVLAGDRETGITILTIKPHRFDVGDILFQRKFPLSKTIKAKQLFTELAVKGASMLIECLENLPEYLANAQPQLNEGACYAKKLKRQDSFVDWSLLSSDEVDRMFRAFDGFVTLHSRWVDNSVLKLYDMIDNESLVSLNWPRAEEAWHGKVLMIPGLCIYNPSLNSVCFKCKDHNWVAFSRLGLGSRSVWPARLFYARKIKNLSKPIILPSSSNNKSSIKS